MAFEIQKVGVIGAGQMGNGIAQVCAQAGMSVLIHDVSEERIHAGLATINGNLNRQVSRQQMDEAERLCHRLAVLDNGKLISQGTPRELIEQNIEPRSGFFQNPARRGHRSRLPRGDLSGRYVVVPRRDRPIWSHLLYSNAAISATVGARCLFPYAAAARPRPVFMRQLLILPRSRLRSTGLVSKSEQPTSTLLARSVSKA